MKGPSGSGKSTLAKVISGIESPTSGRILNTTVIQSSIVDHLFRQSYDSSQTLNFLNKRMQNPGPSFHALYEECIDLLQIPCNERIDSLLESQRKSVELLLSIFSHRYDAELPFFLVLDEYFDKDILSVREKIYKNLQLLCHHPVVRLQAVVITHSKSTCMHCSDRALVLHNGRVFSSGPPKSINTPNQMLWLP